MPSPFPGMDPFFEMDEWQEFHVQMIVEIHHRINPLIRPKYLARIERRVYLERHFTEGVRLPDVHIVRRKKAPGRTATGASTVATLQPRVYELVRPEQHREPVLRIVDKTSREIVTAIEVLSPANKRPGSDGYFAYVEKREELLGKGVQMVEIDLLRGGARLPTAQPLQPTTDYCAFVHRKGSYPEVEVYEWSLESGLPTIPIPLAGDDPDVPLDLQAALDSLYDAGGYDLALSYKPKLVPPLRESDGDWVREVVRKARRRQT
jgi:hypothetical protein